MPVPSFVNHFVLFSFHGSILYVWMESTPSIIREEWKMPSVYSFSKRHMKNLHYFLPMPKSLSSRHLYFFKKIIASRTIIQTKNYRELISQWLKLLSFSQMEYKDFINLLFKSKNFPFLTSKSIKLFCLNCFWCSRQ